jgi:sugar phosphate isomerase/epimerase
VKISFSTLACPDWTLAQAAAIASSSGYDGIELRFVENEDSLWKLPVFGRAQLPSTKRLLRDSGLTISCVDTSCRFHFPDPKERERWVEEGVRMADMAAALEAPGIRVFGDTIQLGATRDMTRTWIAESIHCLAEKIAPTDVEVWLETHGDFAGADETASILSEAATSNAGTLWDPANCYIESKERPQEGAARLGSSIRHVHIKDLLLEQNKWTPVLTGEGNFALQEVRAALRDIHYQGFASFEWEKKWHPEIPDASVALPHFAHWWRENSVR